MAVIIKGKLISEKNPLVCVPILEKTRDEILSRARDLTELGVDMLEWRADAYEELLDTEKVREILEILRTVTKETVLLVTIRSRAQGGLCDASPAEINNILIAMSAVHGADMFDVEFFTFEKPERLIKKLQERGAMVISSHHDFDETPRQEVMHTILSQMREGDADLLKLAVMPKTMSDVLSLLKVTVDFHEEDPDLPLVTMSMGRLGMMSRISGEMTGSCITFATVGKSSAPGQIPWEEMKQILSLVHRYYGEN